nr:MAG TPA: hypothetical protein [Caudoviricetes sp.]
MHSSYLIISSESWLKIPHLLCLSFMGGLSSTFLCFP